MPTNLAIHGAAGRMGQRLVAMAGEDDGLSVVCAIESVTHPRFGEDAGVVAGVDKIGVVIGEAVSAEANVLVDFSVPAATRQVMQACQVAGCAMIIGTTGLTDADQAAIDRAGESIAVLQAPNMSMGVNLLFSLVAKAAQVLGDDYDIEISETHHRFKHDAPSGTAMGIAQAICEATDKDPADTLVYDRHGDDVPRERGQIGMHALRLGDCAGEHTASYATLGERLELRHVATSRDIFVHGALRAAAWLSGKRPGRYHMADVLGL